MKKDVPEASVLNRQICCADDEYSSQHEASSNGSGAKQRQQEPAVVQNGFVTRLSGHSGHSSGSDSRSFAGQSSMQSIPEGEYGQAHETSHACQT